jgi:hypothetical protein
MDQREKTGQEKKIPPGAWMSVSCECCVLSGRGLCDELVNRPEESYRVWCVKCVWSRNLEMRRPRHPKRGCWAIGKRNYTVLLWTSAHWKSRCAWGQKWISVYTVLFIKPQSHLLLTFKGCNLYNIFVYNQTLYFYASNINFTGTCEFGLAYWKSYLTLSLTHFRRSLFLVLLSYLLFQRFFFFAFFIIYTHSS